MEIIKYKYDLLTKLDLIFLINILDTSIKIINMGLFENYKPIKLIGSSETSNVYLSIYKPTNKKVILKAINLYTKGYEDLHEFVYERYLTEITILKELQGYKHIPQYITDFKTDKFCYIVTESIESTIEISRWKYKSKKQLYSVLLDIVLTVEYIHSKGIAHQDIKPENIIISGDQPYVIDFDRSCYLNTDIEYLKCKTLQTTPEYASPESKEELFPYNPILSDIYSLGATFYKLIHRVEYNENEEMLTSGNKTIDNLISKMLSRYQIERPSLDQIKLTLIQLVN